MFETLKWTRGVRGRVEGGWGEVEVEVEVEMEMEVEAEATACTLRGVLAYPTSELKRTRLSLRSQERTASTADLPPPLPAKPPRRCLVWANAFASKMMGT